MLLTAMLSVVVFAGLGLATDGAWVFVQKQASQNAADAAAKAAARDVAYQQYSSADANGTTVGEANLGVPKTSYSISLSYSTTQAADAQNEGLWVQGPPSVATRAVRAKVLLSSNSLFMGILGIDQHSVVARSAVTLYNTVPFTNWNTLFPLALPVPAIGSYTPGAAYYLWGPQAGNFASYYNMPSQWKGLINLNNDPSTTTATIASWAATGYPGTINIGDQLLLYNGGAGNNVGSGLQSFILANPFTDAGGTYTYIRVATFNAYNSVTQKVTISGFQVFKVYLDAVSANSASGIFVGFLNPGGTPITASYTAFGPMVLKTTS